MTARARKILVVDRDNAFLEKLGRRLKKSRFEVQTAPDGARALEAALVTKPDLVITNYHLPLFDGERLRSFLRNNPTTSHIPFIYLIDGDREKDITLASIGPDALLIKPFRWEEISFRIESALNPGSAAEVRAPQMSSGVEGSLKEVSLVDLLQIFNLNRRTGILTLSSNDQKSEVFLKDGDVTCCLLGEIAGEKALFRTLRWQDGTFTYRPEHFDAPRNISRSMDALLMEGMRQLDEWQSMKGMLPPETAVLKLTRGTEDLPRDLRPVTQEIILLLEFYSTLGDIIEKSTHTDYDVCKTILGLMQKGIILALTDGLPETRQPKPLISNEQALELNRILKDRAGDFTGTSWAKILLFSSRPDLVKNFLTGTGELEEFKLSRDNFSNQEILNASFGSLGTLEISEKLRFRLFLLPSTGSAKPLWEPFSEGAMGAVLLDGQTADGNSDMGSVTRLLQEVINQPYVVETIDGPRVNKAAAAETFKRLFERIIEHNREREASRI